MAVVKENNKKVQSFQFGQLVPSENDGEFDGKLSEFELKSLNAAQDFKHNITEEGIRQEREFEAGSAFEMSEIIKEHRGLNRQAEEDFQIRVKAEVEKRIEALREEAYGEGYNAGKELGRDEAYTDTKAQFDEKAQQFAEQVDSLKENIQSVYQQSKDNAYLMVKNLSKWVILKEVDEKYYLARLLEKLIHEINSKSNLVIHVNEDAFGYMPEIVKIVERKVGKLTNVRMEVDFEMTDNGIKLESENNIIDGSLEAQFKSIDALFKSVGLNE
ncbi:MAG: flagellar assembly protein FliH [Bacteriovoracaceae bacterium]|jgi:flagellar assembly protein FliH